MAKIESLSEFKKSKYFILSPGVGHYSLFPEKGANLKGGSFIGKLRILNSNYDLYLPEGVNGKVEFEKDSDKSFNVEYRQNLFCLNPKDTKSKQKTKNHETGLAEPVNTEGGFLITAFTNGMFYRRPSPDSPPYVEEGQIIEKGKVLGLIEVMKTFTPIDFHGTENSESGKVKKIFFKDSSEVKMGQPLFLIEEYT